MIPRSVFARVASQAKDRPRLVERAEDRLRRARAKAYSLPGMNTDADRVTASRQPDRIGRRVAAVIEAEQGLIEARKWADVFAEMDCRYPPVGGGPGAVAALYYGSGLTLLEISDALKQSRQTVLRKRDEWIINAALIAASKGLIAQP